MRPTKSKMQNIKRRIDIYLLMQKCTDEAEFQKLMSEHNALTDASGAPKMTSQNLEQFKNGGLAINLMCKMP